MPRRKSAFSLFGCWPGVHSEPKDEDGPVRGTVPELEKPGFKFTTPSTLEQHKSVERSDSAIVTSAQSSKHKLSPTNWVNIRPHVQSLQTSSSNVLPKAMTSPCHSLTRGTPSGMVLTSSSSFDTRGNGRSTWGASTVDDGWAQTSRTLTIRDRDSHAHAQDGMCHAVQPMPATQHAMHTVAMDSMDCSQASMHEYHQPRNQRAGSESALQLHSGALEGPMQPAVQQQVQQHEPPPQHEPPTPQQQQQQHEHGQQHEQGSQVPPQPQQGHEEQRHAWQNNWFVPVTSPTLFETMEEVLSDANDAEQKADANSAEQKADAFRHSFEYTESSTQVSKSKQLAGAEEAAAEDGVKPSSISFTFPIAPLPELSFSQPLPGSAAPSGRGSGPAALQSTSTLHGFARPQLPRSGSCGACDTIASGAPLRAQQQQQPQQPTAWFSSSGSGSWRRPGQQQQQQQHSQTRPVAQPAAGLPGAAWLPMLPPESSSASASSLLSISSQLPPSSPSQPFSVASNPSNNVSSDVVSVVVSDDATADAKQDRFLVRMLTSGFLVLGDGATDGAGDASGTSPSPSATPSSSCSLPAPLGTTAFEPASPGPLNIHHTHVPAPALTSASAPTAAGAGASAGLDVPLAPPSPGGEPRPPSPQQQYALASSMLRVSHRGKSTSKSPGISVLVPVQQHTDGGWMTTASATKLPVMRTGGSSGGGGSSSSGSSSGNSGRFRNHLAQPQPSPLSRASPPIQLPHSMHHLHARGMGSGSNCSLAGIPEEADSQQQAQEQAEWPTAPPQLVQKQLVQ